MTVLRRMVVGAQSVKFAFEIVSTLFEFIFAVDLGFDKTLKFRDFAVELRVRSRIAEGRQSSVPLGWSARWYQSLIERP